MEITKTNMNVVCGYLTSLCHQNERGINAGKDHSCDILSDLSSINGGSARNDTNGCIPDMFTSLVNVFYAC